MGNDSISTDSNVLPANASSAAGPAVSLNNFQAGAKITRDNYSWATALGVPAGPISFGFRTSAPGYSDPHNHDIVGTFSRFTSAEETAARTALALWSSIANISFSDLGDTNNATIEFANYVSSGDASEAFAYNPVNKSTSPASSDGDVFVNTYNASTSADQPGSYEFQTFIHEIGHALGLEHPGNYNAAPGVTITYAANAEYIQDSRQYTVMSYFAETNTGANFGFGNNPQTPMIDDITAIQRLYGVNTTTRTGNTTYGYHTTGDFSADLKAIYDFSLNTAPVYCIYDAGGVNTLDCSGYSGAQTIDLRSGSFSSVLGLVDDISIADNTSVQVAIGGAGDDTIIAGANGDVLTGGGGHNVFRGVGYNLENDTITDFNINDQIDITDLAFYPYTGGVVVSYAGPTFASFNASTNMLTISDGPFAGVDIYVRGNIPSHNFNVASDGAGGTLVTLSSSPPAPIPAPSSLALATTSDTGVVGDGITSVVTPTITGLGSSGDTVLLYDGNTIIGQGTVEFFARWSITTPTLSVGRHVLSAVEVDAQGNTSPWSTSFTVQITTASSSTPLSGLVWRSTTGSLADWSVSGGSIQSSAFVTSGGVAVTPDASWSVAGNSDFSGDGENDLLWRNTSGALVEWTMKGSTVQSSGFVTYNGSAIQPGATWSIAGTADFNGDGKADILWRDSATGALADWTMNGSTVTASATLKSNGQAVSPDASWAVAGIGDFDGDGKRDILWRSRSGALVDWTMNGASVQHSATITSNGSAVVVDLSWSVAGVGDFNGDGASDLLWRSSNGTLAEWLMNGSQIIGSAEVTFNGAAVRPDQSWHVVSIDDFNGDGKSDLLWRNDTNGSLVEWQMNGATIVQSTVPSSNGTAVSPDSSWSVQSKPLNFG